MVSDEFLDESLDLLVIVLDTARVLGGEDHILDLFYLCRRACQSALGKISLHSLGSPFADVEIRTLGQHFLFLFIAGCLGGNTGIFILLDILRIARTACVG